MNCIVNVAVPGRERYLEGQQRLLRALAEIAPEVARMFWGNTYPPHSPPHCQVSHGFKAYALRAAKRKGYRNVLWLDASIVPLKPFDWVWEEIEKRHVLAFDNPAWIYGHFAPDDTLKYFHTSMEKANSMICVHGGIMGFDFANPVAQNFFQDYMRAAVARIPFTGGSGRSSNPDFKAVRHDQNVFTELVYKYGIERMPMDAFRYTQDPRGLEGVTFEAREMSQA
jgi:hypothetical protein